MNALQKTPKNGILKARCETELEDFFSQLAQFRRLDKSDLVREALREYAERKKRDVCQALTPS
jgi:predicted transcriptional regulator